jgi:transcriptional regulator with GAF, ATPase, and Fis domain
MSTEPRSETASLEELLERGRHLVVELSEQNRALRARAAALEAELEARPAAGVTDGESAQLEARVERLQAQYEQLSRDYAELERQNSNYLSLYVASSQIHGTLVFETVLRNIKEIIVNLIGSDRFSIYLYDEADQELRRADAEGPAEAADEVVPFGDNLLSRVARSGSLCMEIEEPLPSGQHPIAILPLRVGDHLIGVIVLLRLLVQKSEFDAGDMELFDLLAAHAAAALLSAIKHRRLERKNQTLHGLLDLFKAGGAPGGAREG